MKLNNDVKRLVSAMKKQARKLGFTVRVTSGVRSSERQRELYANRGTSPYPVAPPGRSQHEYGLAVDLVAKPYEFQNFLVDWWLSAGGYWSADDPIHFAVFDPATWSRILAGTTAKPNAPTQPTLFPTSGKENFTLPVSAAPTSQGKFTITGGQVEQALNLAAAGQPSVAAALLQDPQVQLTSTQVAQLSTVVTSVPPQVPPVVTVPPLPSVSMILPSTQSYRPPPQTDAPESVASILSRSGVMPRGR